MRTLTFLPWDTELFGCRIGRLDGEHRSSAELEPALAACVAERIECVYCSVPADATSAVRSLEDSGFRLVDQRLTLERRVDATLVVVPSIRAAGAEDLGALEAIAEVSHTDTRFYADPRFAPERCAALYRTWIAKSCQGYAEAVLTEGAAASPAGYVSCHVDGARGRIGLIGVAADRQGQGVGRRLVEGALRWFADAGLTAVSVATQGRNVRAQRLYQAAGFKSESLSLWYHKWFPR
jgi:ribosomal protein S18 acetylase RimI-like enzyme